jgi:hypothetical protein
MLPVASLQIIPSAAADTSHAFYLVSNILWQSTVCFLKACKATSWGTTQMWYKRMDLHSNSVRKGRCRGMLPDGSSRIVVHRLAACLSLTRRYAKTSRATCVFSRYSAPKESGEELRMPWYLVSVDTIKCHSTFTPTPLILCRFMHSLNHFRNLEVCRCIATVLVSTNLQPTHRHLEIPTHSTSL